ncbi:hypothetical protein NA57DRAFT_60196 [Rhizodiscina lignyota]|uniref:Uncharacterized protein n=1 Tax=Rhizodiscina lignyota TaxID=1504668 RepID=A0A9P4I8E4_9PEZI|nr:hypothetical protein NA57DRAFT_60196 [Rhizodiscina lignyota]
MELHTTLITTLSFLLLCAIVVPGLSKGATIPDHSAAKGANAGHAHHLIQKFGILDNRAKRSDELASWTGLNDTSSDLDTRSGAKLPDNDPSSELSNEQWNTLRCKGERLKALMRDRGNDQSLESEWKSWDDIEESGWTSFDLYLDELMIDAVASAGSVFESVGIRNARSNKATKASWWSWAHPEWQNNELGLHGAQYQSVYNIDRGLIMEIASMSPTHVYQTLWKNHEDVDPTVAPSLKQWSDVTFLL